MEIGSVAEVVSMLIAAAAFVGVVVEYVHNRRIKRLELVLTLDYTMETDEEIKFAVTSLDWGAGIIPVPSRWREVVGEKGIRPDIELLTLGLKPGFSARLEQQPIGLLYRHCFVALFNHLERVKLLADQRAIEIEDLKMVGWVATQLVDFQYIEPSQRSGLFLPAIKAWYRASKLDGFILRLREEMASSQKSD